MLCKNCGTSNAEEAKFCEFCGAELSPSNAEESTAAPTPTYVENIAPQAPVQNTKNAEGFAIASLVLGILSFFCFAYIAGTLGIVFGVVAKNKGYKGHIATAGIICGALGIILWIIMVIAGVAAFSSLS